MFKTIGECKAYEKVSERAFTLFLQSTSPRPRCTSSVARLSAEGRKRACQARRDHESGRDRTVEPEQSLRSKLHEQRMARSSSTSAGRVFQFHTASRAAFMVSELRVVQKKKPSGAWGSGTDVP